MGDKLKRLLWTLVPLGLVAWVGVLLVRQVQTLFHPLEPLSGATLGVPVIMPTEGGRLEIASITATERFTRADPKVFYGLSLGTTVSEIEAQATYRYYIDLERRWPLEIRDKVCWVRAGAVKPTLPVAFDTATLRKRTENGWARFNKEENLALLEESLTGALGARASAYTRQAALAGRHVVADFVTTWLLKEQGWKRDPAYRVVVLFHWETKDAAVRAHQP